MGEVERGRKLVVPFPSMRVRDTLRATAVVDSECAACWCTEPLDVVGAACRIGGLDYRIIDATRSLPCTVCGHRGCRFRAVGAPPLMNYDIRFAHIIEAACRIVARCWACHRSRVLDAVDLGRNRVVGPDARLVDLQDRLRC